MGAVDLRRILLSFMEIGESYGKDINRCFPIHESNQGHREYSRERGSRMKAIALMVVSTVFAVLTSTSSEAGYGSCYEVQPICIQGHPACVCDRNNNCFWACR